MPHEGAGRHAVVLGRFDRAFSMPTTEKTLVARLNFTCSRRARHRNVSPAPTTTTSPASSLFPHPLPTPDVRRRASVTARVRRALRARARAGALRRAGGPQSLARGTVPGRTRDRPGGPSHKSAPASTGNSRHGVPCEPETMCSTDHDCAAEFPCTESECVSGRRSPFQARVQRRGASGYGRVRLLREQAREHALHRRREGVRESAG